MTKLFQLMIAATVLLASPVSAQLRLSKGVKIAVRKLQLVS